MRIAVLSPISWRTPPRHYGPWESVVSLLTEELVRLGLDVTLFATGRFTNQRQTRRCVSTPVFGGPRPLIRRSRNACTFRRSSSVPPISISFTIISTFCR